MSDPAAATRPSAGTQMYWSPPATIEPQLVLPDRFTQPPALEAAKLKARESDPGRMGVYVCLLEDRPHLHPSLLALNRHRLAAHQIPLPPDPANDLPTRKQARGISTTVSLNLDDSEDASPDQSAAATNTEGVDMSRVTDDASYPVPEEHGGTAQRKAEWFMWKFTEEEESRRRAFLPLA